MQPLAFRRMKICASATLDSNIYVSALEFMGIGQRFIGMARAGLLRIDTSDAILDETFGVLRDRFGWDGYRLRFGRQELARLANVVSPREVINVTTDPDDNRILECSVEAGSDYIVSHDNHLLKLRSFAGIAIITPELFLEKAIRW
jgi:putative PIN family toxin of toxin-antitoxin system